MPGPSASMKRRAAGWLVDRVTISTATVGAPTRAQMSADPTTLTDDDRQVPALVRGSVSPVDAPNRDVDVRDLLIWVGLDCDVEAGQVVTVTCAEDSTLTGKSGQVVWVGRDSMFAVRRMTVRLTDV